MNGIMKLKGKLSMQKRIVVFIFNLIYFFTSIIAKM